MKGFKIAFICLYSIGLVFRLLHWPGSNLILLIGFSLQLIDFLIIVVNSKYQSKIKMAWASLLASSITIIFNLFFWEYSNIIYLSAIIVSAFYIISKPFKLDLLNVIVIIFISVSTIINFTPKSKLYYIINLTELFNSDNYENQSYFGWSTYSWHLYNENDFENALKANDVAVKILNAHIAFYGDFDFDSEYEDYKKKLLEEKEMIKNKNWETFISPFDNNRH